MAGPEILIVDRALEQGRDALNEHEAKRLLASYGLPVVDEHLAADEHQAVRAAEDLGMPVALKACTHRVLHKKEEGLVMLDVRDAGSVNRTPRSCSVLVSRGPRESLCSAWNAGTGNCCWACRTRPGSDPA